MNPNEEVLGVYDGEHVREKDVLGFKTEVYIPGKLVITNSNVYLYAFSPKKGSVFQDIPLQKITIAKFVRFKKHPLLAPPQVKRVANEFESRTKLLRKGVLKIASSWEQILCSTGVLTGETIILTIKSAMGKFYPEPLSIVEQNDEHMYYISLKVPHKRVPKQEIILKSKGHDSLDHSTQLQPIKERLSKLKELYDEGLITEEEYEQKKKEILSRI